MEDNCRLLCRIHDGTVASIDLSWSFDKGTPWYIRIYGSEGSLRIGWQGSEFRQRDRTEWVPFGEGYDKFHAFDQQLANFVATIRDEAEPLIGPEAAIESVRVVQAAYRSMESGSWEKVH